MKYKSIRKGGHKYCEETKYANAYYDMTKKSPFSNKLNG